MLVRLLGQRRMLDVLRVALKGKNMSFGKSPRLYKGNGKAKYAGTTDLICYFGDKHRKYIIDFKTGGELKNDAKKVGYPEWPLQTAAYRMPAVCEGNGVVHLNKETGEMTWFDYSDTYLSDFSAFCSLCEFWHNRNYQLLDKGIPSVTTITGILDKSGPLTWWAVNSMRDYIYEKLGELVVFTYEIHDLSEGDWIEIECIEKDEVIPIIEAGRKNFRSVSKKATDIGTMVHEAIEQWFKSEGKIEPPKNSPDEVIAGFVAFLEWVEQNKVEMIAIEKIVYGGY